jgi:hypothetical protein
VDDDGDPDRGERDAHAECDGDEDRAEPAHASTVDRRGRLRRHSA